MVTDCITMLSIMSQQGSVGVDFVFQQGEIASAGFRIDRGRNIGETVLGDATLQPERITLMF